ncbi:MAG: lysophospholipase, partial [Anaerolineales bacterium]|nr:lysophospholipase [Anaerolineales bacterium]
HRGHGRSPDRQCAHVNDWGEYRADVQAFLDLVHEREPGLPLFLFGHSMGGLITLNYVLHQPEGLQGVVASAPALVPPQASLPLRLAAQALARLSPQTQLDNGLDVTGLARDTAVITAYQKDPLVHGKVSARWVAEFQKTIAWTLAHAEAFKPPLLIYHGDADRLVPIGGGQQFFEKVQQPDKKYIMYPGGYHEGHNDTHQEQVLADLQNWLVAHLP